MASTRKLSTCIFKSFYFKPYRKGDGGSQLLPLLLAKPIGELIGAHSTTEPLAALFGGSPMIQIILVAVAWC